MKRKIISLAIAALMLFPLAACSGSEEESGSAQEEESSQEDAEESEEDTADASADADADTELVFESQTLIDNDECSVVITDIDESDIWGYFTLTAELENKSSDVTYMFAVYSAAVNGLESDPYFAATVAPGKKSIESIEFDADTLEEYGVDLISDIELSIHVYDEDDWSGNYVADETVHIYPYGEENAQTYERESADSDLILVDNDDVTAIMTGYEVDDTWGYMVNVYLINKTDAEVMFSVDDASVNGYMCDPYWAVSLTGGLAAYSTIYWDESDLEEIGITDMETEVENIEFTFTAYDYDTYDELCSDSVVLEPEL